MVNYKSDVFFDAAEMDVEFVEMLQERAKRSAFGHFGKGIDVFRETFATITKLAIRSGNVGVGVVDVAREKHAGVDFAPIGSHLLAILAAGVEVGNLVCAEDIVHVFGEFCLQRRHDCEFLAHKDLGEQFLCASKDHGLFVEILDERALGKELRHVADVVSCLLGETLACARKNSSADKNRNIGKILDQLRHESKILRAIFLSRHMNLQKSDVDVAQIVVVTLVRVANK